MSDTEVQLPDFNELFADEPVFSQQEIQEIINKCGLDVQQVLMKYSCDIVPELGTIYSADQRVRIIGNIQVMPRPLR